MIRGYDARGVAAERTSFVLRYRPRGDEKIKTDNPTAWGTEVVKSVTSIYQTSINARAESRLDRRLRTSEPHGAL